MPQFFLTEEVTRASLYQTLLFLYKFCTIHSLHYLLGHLYLFALFKIALPFVQNQIHHR